MRVNKLLMAGAALALPLGTLVLLAGPASAGSVQGTGTVVCHVGGTVTFNPPLTPHGTPGSKEIITPSLTMGSCSGGAPPQTTGTTASKAGKVKGQPCSATGYTPCPSPGNKPKVVGACSTLVAQAGSAAFKSKVTWGNPAKPTKTVEGSAAPTGGPGGSGEIGFNLSGTSAGWYAGPAHAHIIFNMASSSQLIHCEALVPNSMVGTLTIDSTNSTTTVDG